MNDNSQRNRLVLIKNIKQKKKIILNRNTSDLIHQSYTSKNNNEQIQIKNKAKIVIPIRLTMLKKIAKLDKNNVENIYTPRMNNRYSNQSLFGDSIKKGFIFLNKFPKKNQQNSHRNYYIEDSSLLKYKNRSFLLPKNNSFQKVRNVNFSHQILSPIDKNLSYRKNARILFPKLNNKTMKLSKSENQIFNYTYRAKEIQKEKEKENIKNNLIKLLDKIKQKILPKRKLKFEKDKFLDIDKLKKNKSCIHQEENLKGKIEFIKTHLDGIFTPKTEIKNKYKSEKRFKINEGYIDLEVLGEGKNISFKTDLIENQGMIYYIFNKNGKMDIIEEKIHKVQKDKEEFKKLLEKFNKNKTFQTLKAKDFENVKKNCETNKIKMDNVYEDLYHIIFKNKSNFLENNIS